MQSIRFNLAWLVACFSLLLSTAKLTLAQQTGAQERAVQQEATQEKNTGEKPGSLQSAASQTDESSRLEEALSKAGENRAELEKAIHDAPAEQKNAVQFLVLNMPDRDLQSLSAQFLLENVSYAYKARNETPWGKDIPEDIFFNDVLPYINIDETREPWRKEFYEMCMPLVQNCKTAEEAAQLLNETFFKKIEVRYSTGRKKANQSPSESIEQGIASCTGLSILLVDACRSVGVPARLAGIPQWPNKRGNHTWVEVWDQQWNFTGACEADPQGLNHTWFERDAALAKKDSRMNAIYAVSFKKTDTSFPMVWSRKGNTVYAENVTDRYTGKSDTKTSQEKVRLLIRVFDASRTKRVSLPVVVKMDGGNNEQIGTGTSRDETSDTNDIFEVAVPRNCKVQVIVGANDNQITKTIEIDDASQKMIDIVIGE